jgi:hypothetical protein
VRSSPRLPLKPESAEIRLGDLKPKLSIPPEGRHARLDVFM